MQERFKLCLTCSEIGQHTSEKIHDSWLNLDIVLRQGISANFEALIKAESVNCTESQLPERQCGTFWIYDLDDVEDLWNFLTILMTFTHLCHIVNPSYLFWILLVCPSSHARSSKSDKRLSCGDGWKAGKCKCTKQHVGFDCPMPSEFTTNIWLARTLRWMVWILFRTMRATTGLAGASLGKHWRRNKTW